jgi:protein tyrosine phosphatase
MKTLFETSSKEFDIDLLNVDLDKINYSQQFNFLSNLFNNNEYKSGNCKFDPLYDRYGNIVARNPAFAKNFNANLICTTYSKNYIVCGQAPVIISHFWENIFKAKMTIITMLTDLIEHGRVKAEQYWPNLGDTIQYGDYNVTTLSENIFATDMTLRKIMIQHTDGSSLQVVQIHWTKWPDNSAPKTEDEYIKFTIFLNKYNELLYAQTEGELTYVHCSAGIGRSGTFIAVQYLLQYLQTTKDTRINFVEVVRQLRLSRPMMVQTIDQYEFIHRFICNYK